MERKMIKIIAIGTLLSFLLTLSLASSQAFASSHGEDLTVVTHGDLLNEKLELPMTLDIAVTGQRKSLFGTGTIDDPACGTSTIVVGGSIDGHNLKLSGWILEAELPVIVGTPIKIEADGKSGKISLTFGPISGGDLSGMTFVFKGEGTVSIT